MKNQGFTLIEIIVSLALFAVVAVVAVGAFLKIIDANRRSEAIETAVNDTSFALESMSRDIRVGSDYRCTSAGTPDTLITSDSNGLKSCSLSQGNMIEFNSSTMGTGSGNTTCHLIHAYELSTDASQKGIIQKAEQSTCGQAFSFIPLTSTSSDLTIQTFDIKVDGSWPGIDSNNPQGVQPKVFILISGTAGISQEDRTAFTVQMSASQRIMEY
jgi:prepilin-type N-terminal cleavage/methylation domain-containing protein